MSQIEVRRVVQVVMLALVVTASAVLSGGCKSDPEVVPSKGMRPPTTADQVKIYLKAPKKYEDLGVVIQEVTPELRWDERGDATKGIEMMKAKAAAKGANGLLLADPDAQQKHSVLAGYKGEYYTVPIRETTPRQGVGTAIFVLEEK